MQAQNGNFLERPYDGGMPAGRPAKQERTPLGGRVARARQQAGLSQEQLAERVGVRQQVIAYWERRPVGLRAEQIVKLAEALGVTTDYLLGRRNGKTRRSGPAGKMRQLFERASRLPRSQQRKVAEFLEPFLLHHSRES